MARRSIARVVLDGVLGIPPVSRLNSIIDNRTIRVRSLDEYYGSRLCKSTIFDARKVQVPELASLPLYDRSRYLRGCEFASKPVFTAVLENVIYDPVSNLVLTPEREVLAESLLPHHPLIDHNNFWKSGGRAGNGNPYWYNFNRRIENISGVCSIFRGIYQVHFHTLVSAIPRASILKRCGLAGSTNVKLLHGDSLSATESYFLPRMLGANVELTAVSSNSLYRIEKLLFPSYLNQQSSGYLPEEYIAEFRNRFMPRRPRNRRNKLFISRSGYAGKWGKRHILNEEKLFSRLRRLGFVMYRPETMSIPEQIDLYYDARMVIGVHGSALTNILYSDQVDVLELNPEFAVHPYFYLLAKSVDARYRFWFARSEANPEESKLFANLTLSDENVEEIADLAASALA